MLIADLRAQTGRVQWVSKSGIALFSRCTDVCLRTSVRQSCGPHNTGPSGGRVPLGTIADCLWDGLLQGVGHRRRVHNRRTATLRWLDWGSFLNDGLATNCKIRRRFPAPYCPRGGGGGATPRVPGRQPPKRGLRPTVSWGGSWRPEPRGRPPRGTAKLRPIQWTARSHMPLTGTLTASEQVQCT